MQILTYNINGIKYVEINAYKYAIKSHATEIEFKYRNNYNNMYETIGFRAS